VKTPFLHATTGNPSPKASAKYKDFNLGPVLSAARTMADFFNKIGQKQTMDKLSATS